MGWWGRSKLMVETGRMSGFPPGACWANITQTRAVFGKSPRSSQLLSRMLARCMFLEMKVLDVSIFPRFPFALCAPRPRAAALSPMRTLRMAFWVLSFVSKDRSMLSLALPSPDSWQKREQTSSFLSQIFFGYSSAF